MSKLITVILVLFFLTLTSCRSKEPRLPQENDVFVCISEHSVAYHRDSSCNALNRCTHRIERMSKEDALSKQKHACGICIGLSDAEIRAEQEDMDEIQDIMWDQTMEEVREAENDRLMN